MEIWTSKLLIEELSMRWCRSRRGRAGWTSSEGQMWIWREPFWPRSCRRWCSPVLRQRAAGWSRTGTLTPGCTLLGTWGTRNPPRNWPLRPGPTWYHWWSLTGRQSPSAHMKMCWCQRRMDTNPPVSMTTKTNQTHLTEAFSSHLRTSADHVGGDETVGGITLNEGHHGNFDLLQPLRGRKKR